MIEWIIICVMYYCIGNLCAKLLDIEEGLKGSRAELPLWLKIYTDLAAPILCIQKILVDKLG